MASTAEITVYFNPRCSKCRRLQELLEEKGIGARYRLYLEEPPGRGELQGILSKLGSSEPADIMRRKGELWSELGLDDATPEERLLALEQHPELLERPILVSGGRAVVARPPEKGLEVL